jgi:hypothetical protein
MLDLLIAVSWRVLVLALLAAAAAAPTAASLWKALALRRPPWFPLMSRRASAYALT